MLKAKGVATDGDKLVLFGLDASDRAKIEAGQYLEFDGREVGLPCTIAIMFGETDESMLNHLRAEGLATGAVVRGPKG